MADASTPQTDRELLLSLNGEIKRLGEAISNFSETLRHIEDKKIGGLEVRLQKVEYIWQQVSGAWKMALVIWSILTASGLIGLGVTFFKR